MAQQIQLRNDTTAGWAYANPVLAQAEIGVDTTLGKFKIGNGTSTWSQLQFQSANIADFVFDIAGEADNSRITVANHDMEIRTIRTGNQDADISINSADDVWINANDQIEITSVTDSVRIQTDDGNYYWDFDENGRMTFPDGSIQSTAYLGVVPLPTFLDYANSRNHLPNLNTNFGWDAQGVWFADAQGGGESYPIYTDFTIPQNQPTTVIFDVEINDNCNDVGVCFYVDGTVPIWTWNPDPSATRIAAQFDCEDLILVGLSTDDRDNASSITPGMYTITFAYDPTAVTDKATVSYKLQGSNQAIATLSINEALPTGAYRVGFAADADSDGKRTYISNLTIDAGPNVYTDNLTNGDSGAEDLTLPLIIKDNSGDNFITFTRTGTGTARIATPKDDLSLRSARDITLIAGDDGPGNVYIGWGDATITPNATNRVATLADVTAATGLGDITFNGVQIIGGGTASSDGLGNGTIRLVPDADEAEDDQFLVIEPTQPGIQGAPGHIHLRAGGTIDESDADLILGGERNSVVVSDTEKEIKVSTAFRSKLYFTNLNSNSDTEFIVSETANILVGDAVYVGNSGEFYIVDAVTFDGGLATVTADGASFGAGAQYLFTREESYNNGWAFGSDGVFSGPYMGGVVVPSLIGTSTNDLSIQSPNNDIIVESIDGDIILNADGYVYIGNSNNTGNEVARMSDRAYVRTNVPTTSLGLEGEVAGLVADDANYHYYCTGTYDGTTHIWKRIAWSVDEWGV
jgi:hypothetical protein